jgi:magnesium transporter
MKKFELPFVYRKSMKTGLPPGTLVYTGDQPQKPVHVTVIEYDEQHLREWNPVLTEEECLALKNNPCKKWINIDGVNDLSLIERVGRTFNLHPLVLEDIAHLEQRPKMEEYDDYMYIVLKMSQLAPGGHSFNVEQVSMILGPNYLLTFQENEGDVFEPVRLRLRAGKGRARKMGCGYLAYTLIDAIVDYYFTIFESMGEAIESLEENILHKTDRKTLPKLHRMRYQLKIGRAHV